jgi:two-component system sensor histidine kinase BaeS
MENAVRIIPANGHIKLSVKTNQDFAEIIVEDDGPGLTDSDIDVAFEPAALYSRYAGIREGGTGLGLALVGRLANKMGGKAIASHSELGGAKFSVKFTKV